MAMMVENTVETEIKRETWWSYHLYLDRTFENSPADPETTTGTLDINL